MPKASVFLLAACLLLMYACATRPVSKEAPPNGYILDGSLSGFADDSWIYLENTLTKTVDSVQIKQGKILFSGAVPDSVGATQYILHTKDFSDFKFFWLENKPVAFQAAKGLFRNARISGSSVQQKADEFDAIIGPIEKRIDSLKFLVDEQKGKFDDKVLIPLLEDERKNMTVNFLRKNPESIFSAYILSVYYSTWGRELTEELYTSFAPELKKTQYGKIVEKYLRLNQDIKPGSPMAEVEQADMEGQTRRLSDLKGKVVLLEFWASWCGPCRKENPKLVQAYQEYKDKGFEIFAVSLDDDRQAWLDAIKKDGLNWIQVSELNGDQNTASLTYGVSGIPDNFLIDRNGVVVERDLRGDKLKAWLKELLD